MTDKPSFLGPKYKDGKLVPASIRTNNPGAMYPGRYSRQFGSTKWATIGGGHKIAIFPDAIGGAAAQFALLASPIYAGGKKKRTLGWCIKKWCGGNFTNTYLRVLEEQTGITKADVLTPQMIENPDIGIPICRAMAWQEAGRDYPLDDHHWQAAHEMAFAYQQQTLPGPATNKHMKKKSRKWWLLTWLERLFGIQIIGGVGWLGLSSMQTMKAYADVAKGFTNDYGLWFFLGMCVLVCGAFAILKYFIKDDVETGRSVPSGDAEVSEENLENAYV